MDKYKYKFKLYVIILMVVALLLALLCIALNIYRIIDGSFMDTTGIVGAVSTFVVSILIIVLVTSIMISSCYEITEKELILRWGILKNIIPIKDINRTVYNSDKDKLAVFYGKEENYMVFSVSGVNPLDIVDALRKHNKRIIFESVSNEEASDDKKSK